MKLDTPGFVEAMYLTPHHNAVWKYVQACTVNWALKQKVHIIWMQSVDTAPKNFAGFYSSDEALNKE